MKNEKIKKDLKKYSFKLREEMKRFLKQIEKNEGTVPTNKEMISRYPTVLSYINRYKNMTIFLNEHLGKNNWKWNKKRNAVQVLKYIKTIKINKKKYCFDSKDDIAKRAGIKTFPMKKIIAENDIILLPKSFKKITNTIIKKSMENNIKKEEVETIKQKLLKDYKNKRWTPYITLYKKFGGLEGYIKYLGFKIV